MLSIARGGDTMLGPCGSKPTKESGLDAALFAVDGARFKIGTILNV